MLRVVDEETVNLSRDRRELLSKLTGVSADGIRTKKQLKGYLDLHKGLFAGSDPEVRLLAKLLETSGS